MKKIFCLIAILLFAPLAHADNYAITEGAGKTMGADEISSTLYPRVKLIHGADGVNSGDVSSSSPLPVTDSPSATTGWTPHLALSAASTNATSVKASAGTVGGWILSNTNAAPRFLKLYNKATAPDVGTDVPAVTILIPGNTNGILANVEFSKGIIFSLGISFAITTGAEATDTGAVAANEIIVNLLYK